jgi:hypothetical protein
MSALVISAYPGCGKSVYYDHNSIYVGNINGKRILDSDSSLFSWIYDSEGNKTDVRNPEFPNNYIKYIKEHLASEDIIFVSSHKMVRDALAEADIPYATVFPKDTLENMKEWKSRFIDRGNTQSFVAFQMEHWSEFLTDMKDEIFPYAKKELGVDTYPFITSDLIAEIKEAYFKYQNRK